MEKWAFITLTLLLGDELNIIIYTREIMIICAPCIWYQVRDRGEWAYNTMLLISLQKGIQGFSLFLIIYRYLFLPLTPFGEL
jgi:hypothetical protein